jgi:hypothetical protein
MKLRIGLVAALLLGGAATAVYAADRPRAVLETWLKGAK